MLIQKSKGSSAFDEQKVKNIAIEYRLQSIFPNPGDGHDKPFCSKAITIIIDNFKKVLGDIDKSQFLKRYR